MCWREKERVRGREEGRERQCEMVEQKERQGCTMGGTAREEEKRKEKRIGSDKWGRTKTEIKRERQRNDFNQGI